MMIMVFLKFTTRPLLSVRRPSSSTCNKDVEYVRMRLFYFIEQNHRIRFAAYGFRELSALVVPTYPGGAPINRLTLNFSWYSDMSIRVISVSSSKRYSAKALASSVLPTPVVPKKMNEPMGRFGSQSRTAAPHGIAHGLYGLVLPDDPFVEFSSRWSSFSRSLCSILLTGMPSNGLLRRRCLPRHFLFNHRVSPVCPLTGLVSG